MLETAHKTSITGNMFYGEQNGTYSSKRALTEKSSCDGAICIWNTTYNHNDETVFFISGIDSVSQYNVSI